MWVILVVLLLVPFIFLIRRNDKVFETRTNILYTIETALILGDLHPYQTNLDAWDDITYNEMLFKFWVPMHEWEYRIWKNVLRYE